ncbi:MAG: hypothetical protein M0008_00880 [Actinomycetota bacterium]|nr:hypothetical protein [Actinomycetota bacterium]
MTDHSVKAKSTQLEAQSQALGVRRGVHLHRQHTTLFETRVARDPLDSPEALPETGAANPPPRLVAGLDLLRLVRVGHEADCVNKGRNTAPALAKASGSSRRATPLPSPSSAHRQYFAARRRYFGHQIRWYLTE